MTAPKPRESTAFTRMLDEMVGADRTVEVVVTGDGSLPSVFPVTELAAASIAAAGVAVSEHLAVAGAAPRPVTVDRRLASLWFASSLRPDGWTPPPPWDPIAGDYRTADGWIRLHTNASAHREAALAVLGVPTDGDPDRDWVVAATASWAAGDLEASVIAAGGAAAAMHSQEHWNASDPGRSVAVEPLIDWEDAGTTVVGTTVVGTTVVGTAVAGTARPDPSRPLAGVRVLDLTRVLAGPVATRFLALLGAEVLRIDPPWWNEPGVEPDVMLGKRSTRLDLGRADDRGRFADLLAHADVLVHGLRPGALDGLGLGRAERRAIAPDVIEVALDAYGWTGPWASRRGFDSLVQMSTGIAESGMLMLQRERPTPLPVQALDQATGYLMASAAIRALSSRSASGRIRHARLSLARTAALLTADGARSPGPVLRGDDASDIDDRIERTGWGPAHRLRPPLGIDGVFLHAERPARPLGGDPPVWSS